MLQEHAMTPPHPDITLALIAGGKGSRLGGVAKGLLRWQGQPLLAHQLALRPLFGDVLLVCAEPAPYAPWALRTVADVVPGRGAPGGVHAALVHARTPWVLALGCDMPFVSAAALAPLLAARSAAVDAVAYRVGGRLEPLLALYRRELAASWAVRLAAQPGPSFAQLLGEARPAILEEAALRAVDAELASVRSVNTPEDLEALGVQRP
jgi:molybdenum cofactor guanylyltransferase